MGWFESAGDEQQAASVASRSSWRPCGCHLGLIPEPPGAPPLLLPVSLAFCSWLDVSAGGMGQSYGEALDLSLGLG